MFIVGDNSLVVDHYSEEARRHIGRRLSQQHWEEMSVKELRWAITAAKLAWDIAKDDGTDQGVLDALEEQYEAIFRTLCEASPQFRKNVLRTAARRQLKYVDIAKSAS